MRERVAAQALSALGHEVRLRLFRLLVRAGHDGLNVGEIGKQLGLPPSTLAHHITALVRAGLVVQERRGREVINTVDYAATDGLIAYLTDECCAGVIKRDEAA
jgi:DNA-binding transcriptional ArsR family regulator